MENIEIVKIFKALCDEKRVEIVKHLQSGEKCACDISEVLDIAQSKLSYHMKILCESGIIKSHSVGKWTHYQISEAGSKYALSVLSEITKVSEDLDNCNKCSEEVV